MCVQIHKCSVYIPSGGSLARPISNPAFVIQRGNVFSNTALSQLEVPHCAFWKYVSFPQGRIIVLFFWPNFGKPGLIDTTHPSNKYVLTSYTLVALKRKKKDKHVLAEKLKHAVDYHHPSHHTFASSVLHTKGLAKNLWKREVSNPYPWNLPAQTHTPWVSCSPALQLWYLESSISDMYVRGWQSET